MNRLNFLRNRNRCFVFIHVYIYFAKIPVLQCDCLQFCFITFSLYIRNGLGAPKEGEPQYVVVHCTGYIKSWPPAGELIPQRGHQTTMHSVVCRSV